MKTELRNGRLLVGRRDFSLIVEESKNLFYDRDNRFGPLGQARQILFVSGLFNSAVVELKTSLEQ